MPKVICTYMYRVGRPGVERVPEGLRDGWVCDGVQRQSVQGRGRMGCRMGCRMGVRIYLSISPCLYSSIKVICTYMYRVGRPGVERVPEGLRDG